MKNKKTIWELSFGFYPGIVIGFRSYKEKKSNNHVLYLPFVDVCLTIFKQMSQKSRDILSDITVYMKYAKYVPELNRMGASIIVKANKAKIMGVKYLNGAEVMATDLRASVSLVLAGLIARKKTMINRIYHLDRGYEKLEYKFLKCGVNIRRSKK